MRRRGATKECGCKPVCEFGHEQVLFIEVVTEGVNVGYVGRFKVVAMVAKCQGGATVCVVVELAISESAVEELGSR